MPKLTTSRRWAFDNDEVKRALEFYVREQLAGIPPLSGEVTVHLNTNGAVVIEEIEDKP